MPLALLPILVDTHAAGVSEATLAHTWAHGTRPALTALGQAPHARAAVHLSGPTLRWAAQHDPAAIELLAELVEKRRVQMLASGTEGPLLSLIPERDAVAQVRRHLRELQQHLSAASTVLWPAALAWDPSLASVLKKTGLDTVFVDEGLLRAGAVRPGPVDGWAEGSFHGTHLRFLPVDRVMSAVAPWTPVPLLRARLRALADSGRRLVTLLLPADRLVAGHSHGSEHWLGALLEALTASKVRTMLPERIVHDLPSAGRSYPPAGTPPLARHLVQAPAREPLDWGALHGEAEQQPGPPVEALISEEPAAERILARTRRLSDALALARREARKRRQSLAPVDAATAALQRAQSSAALHTLPGLGGQLTDPTVRAAAWSAIDTALEAVPVLERPWQSVDLYGDGADELELSTPSLLATLSPRRGGALTELLLRGVGNFANTTERRPSPERSALCLPEPLPVLVGDDDRPEPGPADAPLLWDEDEATDPGVVSIPAPPPAETLPEPLRELLRPDDHHPRLIFQERLLGEATTLDSLRTGQYPEQGDFLGSSWRLERAEPNDTGALEVVMVREGTVRQDPEPPGMIQVQKRMVFALDAPTITVHYEVVNRSREPVGSTLAVELNLGLDGRTGESRSLHVPGQPAARLTAAGDHAQVNDFALRYADLGVLLRVRPLRPARLLHHPVHRLHHGTDGAVAQAQGTAAVFAWPLQLWGKERWQTGLTLQFHRSDRAR